MSTPIAIPPVRILPEDLANKIAAGEVVERPASVVKELVENALDAHATRIVVRLVAAGRRTIEVLDNGHGMSEQDALLAIERHATSKIRKAEDLDNIRTLGFRGEALASIAAVSRFELLTRRAKDEAATRIRVDGGILRDAGKAAAPVGTRISVNRLYFNTPVRAKFLKGITTELSHAVDTVQRHALVQDGVGFQLFHNDKLLLDIPENASLRERVALIWGLNFVKDMLAISGESGPYKVTGVIGNPGLTRSQRSHQFFFLNRRPVVNRSLQYGVEDGYRGLVTIGRFPVCVLLIETNPRLVDINIHPTKREVRFRDDRAVHDALRDLVRTRLAAIEGAIPAVRPLAAPSESLDAGVVQAPKPEPPKPAVTGELFAPPHPVASPPPAPEQPFPAPVPQCPPPADVHLFAPAPMDAAELGSAPAQQPGSADETVADDSTPQEAGTARAIPQAVYAAVSHLDDAPLQVFDTYLVVPDGDRLLIIDQHALHERLTYDRLRADLEDHDYAAQQLAVPLLVDVPPSHVKLLESNSALFGKLGIDIEPFGGNTYQITAVCHLYDEGRIPDAIYRVLDELAQGDLFDKARFVSELLRLTVEACRASVKAGDRLTTQERKGLLDGFRRLRPPYTCPHGRPIIVEITQTQMEKSFRRKQ